MTLVEAFTRRVLRTWRGLGSPHDVEVAGSRAYVTYWGSGAVAAVDFGRGRVVWRRAVGALVHHVQVDPYRGGRLLATDHRTGEVDVLSTRDGRVRARLPGCAGAHHVAVVGTAYLVAACHDADALAVWGYRAPTGARPSLIRVGDGPHGVAEVVLP